MPPNLAQQLVLGKVVCFQLARPVQDTQSPAIFTFGPSAAHPSDTVPCTAACQRCDESRHTKDGIHAPLGCVML